MMTAKLHNGLTTNYYSSASAKEKAPKGNPPTSSQKISDMGSYQPILGRSSAYKKYNIWTNYAFFFYALFWFYVHQSCIPQYL